VGASNVGGGGELVNTTHNGGSAINGYIHDFGHKSEPMLIFGLPPFVAFALSMIFLPHFTATSTTGSVPISRGAMGSSAMEMTLIRFNLTNVI
jgi:hypothetical protein